MRGVRACRPKWQGSWINFPEMKPWLCYLLAVSVCSFGKWRNNNISRIKSLNSKTLRDVFRTQHVLNKRWPVTSLPLFIMLSKSHFQHWSISSVPNPVLGKLWGKPCFFYLTVNRLDCLLSVQDSISATMSTVSVYIFGPAEHIRSHIAFWVLLYLFVALQAHLSLSLGGRGTVVNYRT